MKEKKHLILYISILKASIKSMPMLQQIFSLRNILPVLLFVLILSACTNAERNHTVITKESAPLGTIDALPLEVKAPIDNPISKEKIALGRLLFYDPILSGRKDIACATCHHPEFGYAENIETSIGVDGKGLGEKRIFLHPHTIPFTKRNSQSLLNVAFNGIDEQGQYDPTQAPMFWDLREKSLEAQALRPIRQMEEMRGLEVHQEEVLTMVIKRLQAIPEYRELFQQAFRDPDPVSIPNLSKAIASFERTLLANNSRFDQYMRGNKSALSSAEIEGMQNFIKTGCARCHNGPMLSDFKTHVLGVQDSENIGFVDSGRDNRFAFRTPTLRNLRFTGPYMHSGKIKRLEDVLTFYEDLKGHELNNKSVSREKLDTLAQKLNVEFKEISGIVEFLNSLNDGSYDREIPKKVPSGLPVGGNIR